MAKRGKGSRKGSSFERTICKELSLWFTHGERDDVFWRTAGSGARATTRSKQGKSTANSCGDIGALDDIGKKLMDISVWELKKGYTGKKPSERVSILSFVDGLLNQKDPILEQWITKIKKERAVHERKLWFVVFQRDRKKPVICMSKKSFEYINARSKHKWTWPPFGPTASVYTNTLNIRFMQFYDFLTWCKPEAITRKIKMKGRPVERDVYHGEVHRQSNFYNYKKDEKAQKQVALTSKARGNKAKEKFKLIRGGKPIDQDQKEHQNKEKRNARRIRRRT